MTSSSSSPSSSSGASTDAGNGKPAVATAPAKKHFFPSFAAGGCAGVVTKTMVQPMERVKTILQIQGGGMQDKGGKYGGIRATFNTVLREEGILALWKGNGANCLRIVPAYAVRFATNDSIQRGIAGPGRTVRDLTPWDLVLAGTIAGVVQQVACYPFETVKTRMNLGWQTGQKYNGMLDCVRTTVRVEGWRAMFKGMGASILYGGPYAGAQMTCYELYQRLFLRFVPGATDSGTGLPTVPTKLIAGAFTGVTAQTIVFPMNTVRTRLQVNGIGGAPRIYSGLIDCIRQIWTKEGVMGFYKGCGANNLRMFPNGLIQFAAFDFFKSIFVGDEGSSKKQKRV